MTPAQRLSFLEEVLAAHSEPPEAMSEGRPHRKATGRALDELALHFSRTGRRIYLADEMAVVYPGQESFAPDLLAVLDVDQPAEDERLAWVVADEGKGPDLVMEVLHRGSRDKDLHRNVARYAALGIPEYFVFDRQNFRIHGFRLPRPTALEYEPIRPRLGRYTSLVLGLDLALVDRRLRFFVGYAELLGSDELIDRLSRMMNDIEDRVQATEERLRLSEERAQVESQRAQAESQRAQVESQRAQVESQRADGLAALLHEAIFASLSARDIALPDGVRAAVTACRDAATLGELLRHAPTASASELAQVVAGLREGGR